MNHFFAYLSRMKFIQRWGLMRNTRSENIQEHSLEVAMVAHGLALIRNRYFKGGMNAERVIALAVFHEAGEVITGDLATPIKYFNPEIEQAYHKIEQVAKEKLLQMLPEELKAEYASLFFLNESDRENWKLVKAADKICAYLKCLEELKSGNQEFSKAEKAIKSDLEKMNLPEVTYFMNKFVPSFSLTLDELN
ncbi:5'-deoxynucleotidase [Candidatus Formimonas warabiya]|uniref:5'-deoxynucleotidase n=1 Tax=Formimonas warabiya TaxID=1761012 RepID=A0A3G1KN67_FORW1|nr:5'-deoxynucleotidase [Candidatus Formimonas warabiya]ATW23912.1 5'-deoxynucleotidase [Candidatus Formimonas warabiya]